MSNLSEKEEPFAFVLMPLSQTHDDIYRLGIKATVEAAGMIAQRVDEQVFHREGILQRIYNQIDAADLIIADMTGRNPNVFYEVGYSHAKDKLCIPLTQNADDIPFDLKHHRHIVYSSIRDLRTKLATDLEAVCAELSARSSPIAVELKSSLGLLEKTRYHAYANTTYVFHLTNRNSSASPEIHAMYLYCGPGWTFTQGGADCPTSASEINGHKVDCHFIRCPVPILPRGGWAQVKLEGRKSLANAIYGQAIQDSYKLTGWMVVRASTAKGDFDSTINVSLEVDDMIPF